jgi:hypothetical protein
MWTNAHAGNIDFGINHFVANLQSMHTSDPCYTSDFFAWAKSRPAKINLQDGVGRGDTNFVRKNEKKPHPLHYGQGLIKYFEETKTG